MKRVLITGANSYVGTNVEKWLMKEPDKYYVETLDMKDPSWKDFDFSKFDVVFHVAGIAHIKENKKNKNLYFKVNEELAINTAIQAKKFKVKQFVFMSSMSVYGVNSGVIDMNSLEIPKSNYGKSKLLAEKGILRQENEDFKISILRPPIVYGHLSKGNFSKLTDLANKMIIFPNFDNSRSMIYIDYLCQYIETIIANSLSGLFFPQNKEYVSTKDVVKCIRLCNKKKLILTPIFNVIILILLKLKVKVIEKLFGDLVYHRTLDNKLFNLDYMVFEDTIRKAGNCSE